jgi:hypothetical protein
MQKTLQILFIVFLGIYLALFIIFESGFYSQMNFLERLDLDFILALLLKLIFSVQLSIIIYRVYKIKTNRFYINFTLICVTTFLSLITNFIVSWWSIEIFNETQMPRKLVLFMVYLILFNVIPTLAIYNLTGQKIMTTKM